MHAALTGPDLLDLYELRSYDSVMHWTRRGTTDASIEQTKEWVQSCLDRPHECFNYLVGLKPDTDDRLRPADERWTSKVIGCMGAVTVPEMGYLFNPNYYGKGYATEAAIAFTSAFWELVPPKSESLMDAVANGESWAGRSKGHYLQGVAAYDYVQANVDSENLASAAVLRKAGYILWDTGLDSVCQALGPNRTKLCFRRARPGTVMEPKPETTTGIA